MSNYISIEEATQQLQRDFDWPHSFIRELYFSTPQYRQAYESEDGERVVGDVWYGAPLDLRMIVAAAGNPAINGIEFLCYDVRAFSLQRLDELLFDCEIRKEIVRLSLGSTEINKEDCWVMARQVKVAFLRQDYLGPCLRLGYEIPRGNVVDAVRIDQAWRQCANCSNIWSERTDIEYSRCPDCLELTRLSSSA